ISTAAPFAVSGTLSLQGGSALTAAGPVTLAGNSATTLSIDAASSLAVTGGNTFTQDAGTSTIAGTLTASSIDVVGGRMDFTNGVSAGSFQLGTLGLLEFDNTVSSSVGVAFTDATGTLQLNDPAAFAATISGAQVGDLIHLVGAAATG